LRSYLTSTNLVSQSDAGHRPHLVSCLSTVPTGTPKRSGQPPPAPRRGLSPPPGLGLTSWVSRNLCLRGIGDSQAAETLARFLFPLGHRSVPPPDQSKQHKDRSQAFLPIRGSVPVRRRAMLPLCRI
jgi:hypothetical protein